MENVKQILLAFNDAIHEVESLEDYYYRSNQTLISYKLDIEKNYSFGKKIADILDEFFVIESADERNKKLAIINDTLIQKDVKFRDIFDIVPFEKDNQNSISFSINTKIVDYEKYDPKKAKEKYEHIEKVTYIFIESILSHIIVSFETFLSNIYRILLMSEPQKYLEGQTIPLAALFNDNINETINEKIDSEVSSKMFDSLSAIKIITDKEKISLSEYAVLLNTFKELYYRRNAYVHTKGRANKDYLSKVDKSLTKKLHINDDLICDDIYLQNSIRTLSQIVFLITFELLKKEKASENAVTALSNYYFVKLRAGEYKLAKFVYYHLSKYSSLPFRDKLMYRINYIIAAKQLNELGLVKHELDELDVSATESQFKIAKECLSENFENAYKMLNESYPKSFDAVAIKEWPIFIDFRNTDYYEKFVREHEADFAIQQIDDAQNEFDELLKMDEATDNN